MYFSYNNNTKVTYLYPSNQTSLVIIYLNYTLLSDPLLIGWHRTFSVSMEQKLNSSYLACSTSYTIGTCTLKAWLLQFS